MKTFKDNFPGCDSCKWSEETFPIENFPLDCNNEESTMFGFACNLETTCIHHETKEKEVTK